MKSINNHTSNTLFNFIHEKQTDKKKKKPFLVSRILNVNKTLFNPFFSIYG